MMNKIDYEGRIFRAAQTSSAGEVDGRTTFHYRQSGSIVTAEYSGGDIASGHLVAIADEDGRLDMRYHHVNSSGELMTGTCRTTPELLPDGRLLLHEKWQWTSGDLASGTSILEEVRENS